MNQMANIPPQLLAELRGAAGNGANSLPFQGPEPVPEYVEIWRALMLRKWSILALGLLCAAIAGFMVTQMTPVYQSTATVLLEAAPAKVVSQIEDVVTGASANREHFQTQAEVMKSREIALRVIERLQLKQHPEFDPRQQPTPSWRQWIESTVPAIADALLPPKPQLDTAGIEQTVLREYAKRLSVEPVRSSQLVRVRFESSDANLAASVANAVGTSYIEQDRENRVAVTAGAGNWIRERMAELKKKVDASERALQAYRDKEGLLDTKTTVLSGSGRQMEELTNRLVEAGVRRSIAEEAYKQIKAGESSNFESVPAAVRSVSVQQARAVENDAAKRLAEVSQRYGPDHPRNVAATSELQAAKTNTTREIRAIVDSVVKEYQAAVATEKSIEAQLQQSKGTIQSLNRKEIQLNALEREAATSRQLYETFLTRYGETSATRDGQQANARVVEKAVPAILPVRPLKLQSVTIALAAGLTLGVLAALVLSRLNNTVKTTADVETKLQQPFLTALPVIGMLQRKHAPRMVMEHPQDLYAEGIRTAGTGVLLSSLDTPRKLVAVTSSVAGEGKSTFSINLALSQAKSRRTLLVDADLRKPSIATALKLPEDALGLIEVVTLGATLEAAVQRIDGADVDILTSGKLVPNPLDLLVSQRFRDVLHEMTEKYELVVIDTPPVQLVSDALILGQAATRLIYLVKANDTPIAVARTGLKRVSAAGIKIIGVVLNHHDYKRAERYYGESYGYGKYSYKNYGVAKFPKSA
jgi:succinoglycan biosynthesis transport protein ExoP